MARIEGFALRGLLKAVKESGGSIAAVLAALPEAERASFARPIVASEWYPYAAFHCVHRGDAACEFEGSWQADRPGGWLG
jgi:hypothetical protein